MVTCSVTCRPSVLIERMSRTVAIPRAREAASGSMASVTK